MRQVHNINCIWLFLCLLKVPGYAVGIFPEDTQAIDKTIATTGKVIARVNGQPIYMEQVKPEVEKGLKNSRGHGTQKPDPELVMRLQIVALDKLIGNELIHQESRKLKIADIETQVEQRLKALEEKHGAGERMERYWKMRNHTLESAREFLRTRVRVDAYLKEQGILEPEIPEEQVRQLYEGDPGSFSRKEESIEVSHVLMAFEKKAGLEAKAQARQKAEKIRKQILEGQDFAEMAKTHSNCNSASGGGSLEYIKRGYMPEEFDKVAFAMEKDAVSEVVESRFGYHIIKVLDRRPAGPIPLAEVRDFITKYLQEAESKKRLAAHIAELRSRAKIELLLAGGEEMQ